MSNTLNEQFVEAVKQRDAGEVKKLLAAGAEVETRDDLNCIPLHIAAYNGDTETVATLLDHGADINASERTGWTALHFAAYWDEIGTANMLIARGADLDRQDEYGRTALHLVVEKSRGVEIVEALLEAGADISIRNKKGKTPLSLVKSWQEVTRVALANATHQTSLSVSPLNLKRF